MLYFSLEFGLLFLVTGAAFYIAPRSARAILLLIASYVFYADFIAWHLALLIGVTIATYGFGIALGKWHSRALLVLGVGVALSALLFFKYYHFVLDLAGVENTVGARSLTSGNLVLPIGISFYTFQAVSYLVDVYRRTVAPVVNPLRVALYLAFFPQILAGPIERAGWLMGQLEKLQRPAAKDVVVGMKVVLWGLFCKLIIADKLAIYVDVIYGQPEAHTGSALLLGVYLYAFQIFFDFYGYTNVSIGLARCLGIRLNINFDNPYLARSIRDFWRRWHITLTSWFRDYVYLPLGGKHHSRALWYAIVISVFLVSGLWHGAAINFLLWGFLHGLMYLAGSLTFGLRERIAGAIGLSRNQRVRVAFQTICTFHLVSFAWLVFRIDEFTRLRSVLQGIVYLDAGWFSIGEMLSRPELLIFLPLVALVFVLQSRGTMYTIASQVPENTRQIAVELVFVNCLLVPLLLLGDIGAREYIYFQF